MATDTANDEIIYSFLLIILVLSLFEKSEESIINVILYGVPGLPSVSISQEGSYSTVRKEILKSAPNLSNFYFVLRGLIIKDEDIMINRGRGHVVINVQTRDDLKGGAKKDRKKGGRKRCLTNDA